MSSGFVCAATPSFVEQTKTTLSEYPDYITQDQINNFLIDNCNKFLSSIGVVLTKGVKFTPEKFMKKYDKRLKKINDISFLDNLEFYIDSAGYQIQNKFLRDEDITPFLDTYYNDFLVNRFDKYDKAFLVDIAPGVVESPFNTWDEMKDLNLLSYSMAASLPQEIKDKLIYVHHFRSPKIHNAYNEILNGTDIPYGFKNFSTGGMFGHSSQRPPNICLYVIPIMEILNKLKANGIKSFNFHVLGTTDYKDIIGYKIISKHIKEVHDVDVTITYDSTGVFKTVGLGRYIYALDPSDKTIWRVSVKSEDLELNYRGLTTRTEMLYTLMNDTVRPYNMRCLDPSTDMIYCDDRNSFTSIVYNYIFFYTLQSFVVVEEWCDDFVETYYDKLDSSLTELDEFIHNLNSGKTSRKTSGRSENIINSMRMIERFDEDYCEEIINVFEDAKVNSKEATFF